MKVLIFILAMGILAVNADDLTTKSGKVYSDYETQRVTARGLEIFHLTGVTVVPFSELPDDIRAQYANAEREVIAKEKALHKQRKIAKEKQDKEFAQKKASRPIILKPIRKTKEGFICNWSRNDMHYASIEDALKHASEYERQMYKKAKESDEKNLKALISMLSETRGITNEQRRDYFMANRPGEVNQWLDMMNTNFDVKYYASYPMSKKIVVKDLPKNTLSNVNISAVIYYSGTIDIAGEITQIYSTNKQSTRID